MNPERQISREKVMEDIRALLRDAEELLKVTTDDVNDKVKDARAKLAQAIENARGTYGHLEARTMAAARATDEVIRSHPYQSIGYAFGLGLIVGVLAARS